MKNAKRDSSDLHKEIIKENEPFIIALGMASIPFPYFYNEIPFAVQAVYPVGDYQVEVDAKTMSIVSSHFERREAIKKQSGSNVQTNLFLCQKSSRISGLIFSDSRISQINLHPEKELSFIQNYMTINKLPQGWLKTGEEWWWDSSERIMRQSY